MKKTCSLLLALSLTACATPSQENTPTAEDAKIVIAASFYTLAFLAEQIGGDAVEVIQVVPNGVEPHDYEPTPQELTAIYKAKILAMNGQGLDPWAEQVAEELRRQGVAVIMLTEGANLLPAVEGDHHEEDEHEEEQEVEDEHGHEEGEFDPHVWLDPTEMTNVVVRLRDAMIAADPSQAALFTSHALSAVSSLIALDAEFRSALTECKQEKIIVSHNAFQYLARRYGFETIALSGISPDEEPSPKKMAEIIETVKNDNLKVVFFESLVSPKLAEAVAREAGVQTLVLNPLEGLTAEEEARGENYFTVMQQNVTNLALALECE